MTHCSNKNLLYAALALCLGFGPAAHSAPLLLDFGPTIPSGANLTNSPYHAVSGDTTFQTWNVLGTSDSSSLVFGDGTAATGVSIDLGVSPNTNIINFANQPSASNSLGNNINSGIYDGNSVGTDGLFSGSSGQNNVLGLKIIGLGLGTYDVYVSGINTNVNAGNNPQLLPMNMGALATGDVSTLDVSSLSFTTVDNLKTDAWAVGENFSHFSVTLTATDPVLTIFTVSDNPDAGRGFLNSVQVIPEPGMLMLVFGSALGSVLIFRRRSR